MLDFAAPEGVEGRMFDMRYPNSELGLSIDIVDRGQICVQFVGLGESRAVLAVRRLPDWREAHLIHVSLRHDDDLRAEVAAVMDDGEHRYAHTIDDCIYMPNFRGPVFDVALNADVGGDARKGRLAMAQTMILRHGPPSHVSSAYAHFAEHFKKPDRSALLYHDGSSSVASSGERNQQIHGEHTMTDMATVLSGSDSGSPS